MSITINKYIDHTLLKPDATRDEIKKICDEAKKYNFASVCINPCNISFCKKELLNSNVKVCTVIGFPLGQMTVEAKVAEAKDAIAKGANEVDMVLNIAALKQNNLEYVTNEIKLIVDVCHKSKVLLKVIIETCLLNQEQKINACKCVSDAKADFIKTSTGFSVYGATVEDVALLRKYSSPDVKVKASGGIRSLKDAIDMINAGAERLGTSKGVMLIKG